MKIVHTEHNEKCAGCYCKPCLDFSTDGTLLGSYLAHHFGTTDESQHYKLVHLMYEKDKQDRLTGMPEEQADWDEGNDDPSCEI